MGAPLGRDTCRMNRSNKSRLAPVIATRLSHITGAILLFIVRFILQVSPPSGGPSHSPTIPKSVTARATRATRLGHAFPAALHAHDGIHVHEAAQFPHAVAHRAQRVEHLGTHTTGFEGE